MRFRTLTALGLSLILFFALFSEIKAQCGNIDDPEYHSLRPYRAEPCDETVSETDLYCGNDLIAREKLEITINNPPAGAEMTCVPTFDGQDCTIILRDRTIDVQMSFPDAELPIMGNTQLVPNSDPNRPLDLDSAQRMNEYLSWYLNGVVFRPEESPLMVTRDGGFFDLPFQIFETDVLDPDSHSKLVDFSGPLRKLLPQRIQIDAREKTVADAGAVRHDQIAVCTRGGVAVPCYEESVWAFVLNEILPNLTNINLLDALEVALQGGAGTKVKHRLTDWQGHFPPHEEDYSDFSDYWEAYLEWRGQICTQINLPDVLAGLLGGIPGAILDQLANLGVMFCSNNPLNPDWRGSYFSYIPFSSTEDRVGDAVASAIETLQPGAGKTAQPDESGIIIAQSFDENGIPIGQNYVLFTSTSNEHSSYLSDSTESGPAPYEELFFSHMEETVPLLTLLQQTYLPAGENGFDGPASDTTLYDTDRCDLGNARWNSGDQMLASESQTPDIQGTITYSAKFNCHFILNTDGTSNICTVKPITAISLYTETPKGEEVWQRAVAGEQAIYKRMTSKALLDDNHIEILDLPGVTSANYSSTDPDVTVFAGDPGHERPGSSAEIYIPHLGGIYEYFLKGIQQALRPKDLAYSSTVSLPMTTSAEQNIPASNIPGEEGPPR